MLFRNYPLIIRMVLNSILCFFILTFMATLPGFGKLACLSIVSPFLAQFWPVLQLTLLFPISFLDPELSFGHALFFNFPVYTVHIITFLPEGEPILTGFDRILYKIASLTSSYALSDINLNTAPCYHIEHRRVSFNEYMQYVNNNVPEPWWKLDPKIYEYWWTFVAICGWLWRFMNDPYVTALPHIMDLTWRDVLHALTYLGVEIIDIIDQIMAHCIRACAETFFSIDFVSWESYILDRIYITPKDITLFFVLKFVFVIAFVVIIRSGTPRYRFDYLTKIGWLKFLNFSLGILILIIIFFFFW